MSILYRRAQLLVATLLSLGFLALMAGTASAHAAIPAHAKVNKAIPAIGSTVSQAPTTVTVFTLENINPDPKLSNLFVYSPAGDLISQGNASVSLTNPREMSIAIKPDPANLNGVYIVRWITVSALDGDPDQGAFFFTVKTGAVATPTPATSTGQANPPATTSGTPLWVPILVGVLALLVGLGGGLAGGRALGQRRPAAAVSSMRKEVAQQQQKEEEKIKNP